MAVVSARSMFVLRVPGYVRVVRCYWGVCERLSDFVKVMRVRLAQSKVGRIVCPRPITVTVNLTPLGASVVIRSHTTDISVLEELLVSGSYVPVARETCGSAATIVDLGANTGLAARWLLGQHAGATIVCVEPERGNTEVLRANLAGYPSATVYQACIGQYARQVRLHTESGEFAFQMHEVVETEEPGELVDVITMDQILQETAMDTIDLLKCDIEGAERELFASCASWISRVRHAVVECHGEFDAILLLRLLSENGADFEVVNRELNPEFSCEVVTLRAVAASTERP